MFQISANSFDPRACRMTSSTLVIVLGPKIWSWRGGVIGASSPAIVAQKTPRPLAEKLPTTVSELKSGIEYPASREGKGARIYLANANTQGAPFCGCWNISSAKTRRRKRGPPSFFGSVATARAFVQRGFQEPRSTAPLS